MFEKFDFWQDAKDNLKKDIEERWNNYFQEQNYKPKGKSLENFGDIYREVGHTFKDMSKTYFQMKRNNIVGSDDYYHCKANYLASRRGAVATMAAKILGTAKEDFDYYKNIIYNGLTTEEALADKKHDLAVNAFGLRAGRQCPQSTPRRACGRFVVKGMVHDGHF